MHKVTSPRWNSSFLISPSIFSFCRTLKRGKLFSVGARWTIKQNPGRQGCICIICLTPPPPPPPGRQKYGHTKILGKYDPRRKKKKGGGDLIFPPIGQYFPPYAHPTLYKNFILGKNITRERGRGHTFTF